MLIPIFCFCAPIWIYKPNIVMARHGGPEARKSICALLTPIAVINFASFQYAGDLKPKDMLTEGVWVTAHDGVVPVNLKNADLCFVDSVLNHLIDGALDIRVVYHGRLNHESFDIVVVKMVYILFVQTGTLQE